MLNRELGMNIDFKNEFSKQLIGYGNEETCLTEKTDSSKNYEFGTL